MVVHSFARAVNSYVSHHVHDYVPLLLTLLINEMSVKFVFLTKIKNNNMHTYKITHYKKFQHFLHLNDI